MTEFILVKLWEDLKLDLSSRECIFDVRSGIKAAHTHNKASNGGHSDHFQ